MKFLSQNMKIFHKDVNIVYILLGKNVVYSFLVKDVHQKGANRHEIIY